MFVQYDETMSVHIISLDGNAVVHAQERPLPSFRMSLQDT